MQGDVFGLKRVVVVEHPLSALGVTNDPLLGQLAVDVDDGAVTLNDRHVLAIAVCMLKDFQRGELGPFQLLGLHRAAGDYLQAAVLDFILHILAEFVLPALMPVVEHDQLSIVVIKIVILSDTDFLIVDPVLVVVASAAFSPWGSLRVRILALKLFLGDHFGDKSPLGIEHERRAGRIEIDIERIRNRANHNHLVERLIALVLGHHAPVSPSIVYGGLETSVIRHIGAAVALNGPYHAPEQLGVLA